MGTKGKHFVTKEYKGKANKYKGYVPLLSRKQVIKALGFDKRTFQRAMKALRELEDVELVKERQWGKKHKYRTYYK